MGMFRAAAGAIGNLFDLFFKPSREWMTLGGRTTRSGEPVSEDTALNYSAVWCATRLLCGTGASLPLPIYRGNRDEDREKDRDHRVYWLLNKEPNPEQTAYDFRSIMWQWQVNWGNAYAEIEREGNDPEGELVALWPLHPDRVEPKRDEFGNLFYRVREEGAGYNDLEPWRMFHVPSTITVDGIVGQGVISRARETIGSGIAAEKTGAKTFGSGAMPRVVIEHPGNWAKDQRDAFRSEWEEIHGGSGGKSAAVLGGGATAKPLSFNAADSQFIESRQFTVEEIARWYGIPPHLLQHLLRATFNNIEELGINFVQYSLIPWLETWEQRVWQKLFTEREKREYFVEHNVDALQRGNQAARASYYQSMTAAALMTRNECRKLENLNPVPGGDVFLVQGAMVPLDDDGKPESEFAGTVGGNPVATKTDVEDVAKVIVRHVEPFREIVERHVANIDKNAAARNEAVIDAMQVGFAESATRDKASDALTVEVTASAASSIESLVVSAGEKSTSATCNLAEAVTGMSSIIEQHGATVDESLKRHLAVLADLQFAYIQTELDRMLTLETNKMQSLAKNSGTFLATAEEFYVTQSENVRRNLLNYASTLAACGYTINVADIVDAWVKDGIAMMKEAAGVSESAADLKQAVQFVSVSPAWCGRSVRAVERMKNATAVL